MPCSQYYTRKEYIVDRKRIRGSIYVESDEVKRIIVFAATLDGKRVEHQLFVVYSEADGGHLLEEYGDTDDPVAVVLRAKLKKLGEAWNMPRISIDGPAAETIFEACRRMARAGEAVHIRHEPEKKLRVFWVATVEQIAGNRTPAGIMTAKKGEGRESLHIFFSRVHGVELSFRHRGVMGPTKSERDKTFDGCIRNINLSPLPAISSRDIVTFDGKAAEYIGKALELANKGAI